MFVVYNVGMLSHPVGDLEHKVNDGKYHVMRFERQGQNASLQFDDNPPYVRHPPGLRSFPSTTALGRQWYSVLALEQTFALTDSQMMATGT